ncbi:hypothetical protein QE429_004217 [Bacillus sp. SORGH_AS 510]|nr:hypothetical protein [Bacillus sp. SORGH_AS_0510]
MILQYMKSLISWGLGFFYSIGSGINCRKIWFQPTMKGVLKKKTSGGTALLIQSSKQSFSSMLEIEV